MRALFQITLGVIIFMLSLLLFFDSVAHGPTVLLAIGITIIIAILPTKRERRNGHRENDEAAAPTPDLLRGQSIGDRTK